MGDNEQNVKENTAPLNILLPICVEAKSDVFFNILRNVVSRGRTCIGLESAFKSSLTGEKIEIDLDNLSVDWRLLTSDSEQIWQTKVLASWATRHFPSIGKKMISAAWQPPTSQVQVIGSMKTIDEVDTIIFSKMKLRILELNVSLSTQVDKLKYFVRVPANIGKFNELYISPKIRAYDIENEYLEECWKALKVGEFLSTVEYKRQVNSISTLKRPQPSTYLAIGEHRNNRDDDDAAVSLDEEPITQTSNEKTSTQYTNIPLCIVQLTDIISSAAKINVGSEPTINPPAKRARLDNSPDGDSNFDAIVLLDEVPIEKSNTTPSNLTQSSNEILSLQLSSSQNIQPCNALTNLIPAKISVTSEPTIKPAAKLACLDDNTNFDSSFDDLRVVVLELRKDIQELTKWHDLDGATNIRERLHLNIFNQKDTEIAKLKLSLQTAIEENDSLKASKFRLEIDSEEKSSLISALQKGVEANFKLLERSQEDSSVFQIQIQVSNDTIKTLSEELSSAKIKQDENESLLGELRVAVVNSGKSSAEAEQNNTALALKNEKLQAELNAALSKVNQDESQKEEPNVFQIQIQVLNDTIKTLREDLSSAKIKQDENECLLGELRVAVVNSGKSSAEAEVNNAELAERNKKLQTDLDGVQSQLLKIKQDESENLQNALNNDNFRFKNMLEELRVEVDISKKSTAEAEVNNAELAEQNKKLQAELDAAQNQLLKIKQDESENYQNALNDVKLRFKNLLRELRIEIDNSDKASTEAEKNNAELAEKNKKLQAELDAAQNQLSLKSTFENRHDEKIRTDLMKTPVILNDNNELLEAGLMEIDNSAKSSGDVKTNNVQLTERNKKLQGELDAAQRQQSLKSTLENRHESNIRTDSMETPDIPNGNNEIRRNLLNYRFAWIKFNEKTNLRCPGFVHPPDKDGFTKAQKVTMTGNVSSIKKKFFSFSDNIPDSEKEQSQVSALKKLNKRFNFTFD